MKTAALCLILILSAVCHRGLCAVLRENENVDSAAQLADSQKEEVNMQDFLVRDKRHIGLHICTYCCNCCKNKGCGHCCRT